MAGRNSLWGVELCNPAAIRYGAKPEVQSPESKVLKYVVHEIPQDVVENRFCMADFNSQISIQMWSALSSIVLLICKLSLYMIDTIPYHLLLEETEHTYCELHRTSNVIDYYSSYPEAALFDTCCISAVAILCALQYILLILYLLMK